MEATSINEFYKEMFGACCPHLEAFLDDDKNRDIGHFNVFNISDLYKACKAKPEMPYNKRNYYKISLVNGLNSVEYADKTVEIKDFALLFSTPRIPYRYNPLSQNQKGHFCVFTKDFLAKSMTGIVIEELPVFKPDSDFIFEISSSQYSEVEHIFGKMRTELDSDYMYKYDLLRNYVMELIHFGQKLKPHISTENSINASARITTLFIELLERQFPVESASQALQLRTAKDYADTLRIHVNHLNKVLKDAAGKTTTDIISNRIAQEAKILLKQTNWNVSEIAYSLGFEEVAHFSNFFKKHTRLSPLNFRN